MCNSSAAYSPWKCAVVTLHIGKHPNEVPEPFISVPNVVQVVTTLPPLAKMAISSQRGSSGWVGSLGHS